MTSTDTIDFLMGQRAGMLNYAAHLLGNRGQAEDVVQEACLRTLLAEPLLLASPQAWLRTVVRHLAMDHLRRRQREQGLLSGLRQDVYLDGTPLAPSAEELVEQKRRDAAALRWLLDHLGKVEVLVLLLREVFEADYADIARAAGKSPAACRQLLHRSQRRLRSAPMPAGPSRHLSVREQVEDPAEDPFLEVCWRAIDGGDAQGLMALLSSLTMAAGEPGPNGTSRASRTESITYSVVPVQGRFRVALLLNGQLLCALPVGRICRPAESARVIGLLPEVGGARATLPIGSRRSRVETLHHS